MRAPLAIALTLALAFALPLTGCIAPPGDELPGGTARAPNTGGAMTATDSATEEVDVCKEGGLIGGTGQFCAERRVEVDGQISGLTSLDVDLSTFNGAVEVYDDKEGRWGLTAILRARGATQEEAKRNLEKIQFTWSHSEGDSHFLTAEARSKERESSGLSASLAVTLPRSLTLMLVAETTNGGVTVKGMRTDGLAARTTNGGITIEADVTQVDLSTTNGGIDAVLSPIGPGRLALDTTNGGISLQLPEDAQRGYDLEAETTNGRVDISLKDGETTRSKPSNPYYDPQNDGKFKTHGYEERKLQSQVRIETTNGGIDVGPK